MLWLPLTRGDSCAGEYKCQECLRVYHRQEEMLPNESLDNNYYKFRYNKLSTNLRKIAITLNKGHIFVFCEQNTDTINFTEEIRKYPITQITDILQYNFCNLAKLMKNLN